MKSKTKKIFVGVLAAVIVLSVGVMGAFTAEAGYGKYFADADHDGICDWAGSGYHCTVRDNAEQRCTNKDCINETCVDAECNDTECADADENGVCDNYRARRRRCFGGCHNR